VDIARTIAERLGVRLEIKDMAWTGLIPALAAGKIDCIISGITGTLERAKSITFTSPYYTTGLCTLLSAKKARASTRWTTSTPKDASSPCGPAPPPTWWPPSASTRPPSTATRTRRPASRTWWPAVADAFLYDQISIAKHHRQNPETTRAILVPFTYEPFCHRPAKRRFRPVAVAGNVLTTIKNDGTLHALYQKHFGELLKEDPGK